MYHVKKLVFLFSLSGEIGSVYNPNALYIYLKFSKHKFKTSNF